MRWITDPAIFNYLLIGLQVATVVRWAFARSWVNVIYWVFATGLVATVTWGFKR